MNLKKLTMESIPLKQKVSNSMRFISQYVSQISSERWEVVFLGILLAYAAALVFQAMSYSPDARLFPMLIGVPLLGMILVKILITHYPIRSISGTGGLVDRVSKEIEPNQTNEDDSEETASIVHIQRELTMTSWIVGVFILIWLLGFLNASAIFMFSFIYIYENSLIRAGGVTLLALIFIYGLFVELLSLPLWEGIILSSVLTLKPKTESTNND